MSYCKSASIPTSYCGLELYEDNAGGYHIFCTDGEGDLLWSHVYDVDIQGIMPWDAAASDVYYILMDSDFDGDFEDLRINSGYDEDEANADLIWCRDEDARHLNTCNLLVEVEHGSDELWCYSGIWAEHMRTSFGMEFC